jgi:methylmalonyl-CoA/ethylmalonyl-CoA epimerase
MMGVKGIREKNVYFYYIILRLTGNFYTLDFKRQFGYYYFPFPGGNVIKKIDHIAVAVDNMEEGIKKFRDVLGLEFRGTEVVPGQQVIVAFFRVGDINIELTAPTEKDSPMGKFLDKYGPGIHHLAFEVDDIAAQIHEFREKGVRMVHEEGQAGADNAQIAFVHPKSFSGVMVELKEKCREK